MVNHQFVSRIKRALRYSTIESMAFGVVQGAGDRFTPAYAVALGASNTQLALLTSIPTFWGALALSASARLPTLLGSRKRVVLLFAALQALVWLPILGIGALFPDDGSIWNDGSTWLIAFVALYTIFGTLIGPAWGSIMAEVVPDRVRGHYFGQRSRWSTLANMASFLLAGGLLYLLRDQGMIGFFLVFGLAMGFRMVSLSLLTTLAELPHNPKDDDRLSPAAFLRQLPGTNLGRMTLYLIGLNFVVNLAGPFFVPYMLRELQMDYLTFTVLEVVSIAAALWAVTHWGDAADRTGNRKMLLIAGPLVGVVPLLWMVSGNVVALGFVEFFTGFAWAGFNLLSTNYIFDATTPRNRTTYLAYFSAGVSIATALGALTGGLLIEHMPKLMDSAILSMFLLSGCLRLLLAAAFLPHIQEVRRVRSLRAAELFHILLGGKTVHQPVHHGRFHHHFHGHRGAE
jgi:MFS family permease